MDLTLTIVGSGASAPTPQRALASCLIQRGPERILVDCGEGTQLQLARLAQRSAGIGTILLTHCHADHYLGLPGLLKTWTRQRTAPLEIIGPPGTWQLVRAMHGFIGQLDFPLLLKEVEGGAIIRRAGYRIETLRTEHRIYSLAYALQEDARPGRFDIVAARADGFLDPADIARLAAGESVRAPGLAVCARPEDYRGPERPGRRVVVSGDTGPMPAMCDFAAAADLLVHEATFLAPQRELARRTGHSCLDEVIDLAATARARALVCTHLSSRYGDDTYRARMITSAPHPGEMHLAEDLAVHAVSYAPEGMPRP